MELYAVLRRRSGDWKEGQGIEAQAEWPEHAAFMMQAAADDFVVLAGPIDEEGALIVVHAESREAVEQRFGQDPWTVSGLLVTERIARWQLRTGSVG
jgi:uncharacterized protein YciI